MPIYVQFYKPSNWHRANKVKYQLLSSSLYIVVVLYNYGISYVTNFTGEAKNSLETSV